MTCLILGEVYHVNFAYQLKQLGVKAEKDERNFSCSAVSEAACNVFSSRRKTIKGLANELRLYLESRERGMKVAISEGAQEVLVRVPNLKKENCDISRYENRKFADILALVTRPDKPHVSYTDYLQRWREQADALGLTMTEMDALITRQSIVLSAKEQAAVIATIKAESLMELTANDSFFTENVLYQTIAEKAIGLLSVDTVDTIVSDMKASKELVYIMHADNGLAEYTTREQLTLELGLIEAIKTADKNYSHCLARSSVQSAIEKVEAQEGRAFTLEQRDTILRVLHKNGAICAYEGLAGTGKSVVAKVAQEAYSALGYRVYGAAFSTDAAEVLEASSHIKSQTYDKLLINLETGTTKLNERSVVLIDEAGMSGIRKAYHLMHYALKAGAKVIYAGDEEQIDAIELGGILPLLRQLVGSSFITKIHRQQLDETDHNPGWRRDIVRAVLDGDSLTALHDMQARQLVHIDDNDIGAKITMVDRWHSLREQAKSPMMIAAKNADVDSLNNIARRQRIAAGYIKVETEIEIETNKGIQPFAVGDEIITTFNSKRKHDLTNGNRATITDITPEKRGYHIVLKMEDGQIKQFHTDDYRNIKGNIPLAYSYCSTINRSQGRTKDQALVYASPYINKSIAYVALSRARYNTELFLDRETWKSVYIAMERQRRNEKIQYVSDEQLLTGLACYMNRPNTTQLAVDKFAALHLDPYDILKHSDVNRADVGIDYKHPFLEDYRRRFLDWDKSGSPNSAVKAAHASKNVSKNQAHVNQHKKISPQAIDKTLWLNIQQHLISLHATHEKAKKHAVKRVDIAS